MREHLIAAGHHEALELQTWDEAENALSEFSSSYVSETHPSKDDQGKALCHMHVDLFKKNEPLQKPEVPFGQMVPHFL